MISITRLLCEAVGPGDHLRYEKKDAPRPVVVWNCTRQCNLNCIHCYASADNHRSPGEMDTAAGKAFIRDLADFGVPVILFSGGLSRSCRWLTGQRWFRSGNTELT